MPSNKETLFQDHICNFLKSIHHYDELQKEELPDQSFHIIESHLIKFIKNTQSEQFAKLFESYQADSEQEIIKALKHAINLKPLWLIMREGLMVKGIRFELYKPKPRSNTSEVQTLNYQENIFCFKKEYYYNANTKERIDLVIWLNGLPIIVIELKHEDEGQNAEDAIFESFLKRDLNNQLYKLPFLYIAASNVEVKVATNPNSEKLFRWFNAQLVNEAETNGEYPVEHLYRFALCKENIVKYLEHFLVFVPAKQHIDEDGVIETTPSFTIFPRYHQLRASKHLAGDVLTKVNDSHALGLKYLINHSAGSGKTLTIAWMADQLDSLYDEENNKVFDNIIILTDRKSLDKNIQDDLDNFVHLKNKIKIAKKSKDLANHLEQDRDIIVSTIHKFGYIQEKLTDNESLKSRRIAFLIDEAHRSQEGRMALKMRTFFTDDGREIQQEEDEENSTDDVADQLQKLNIGNQVFVAFTATTTPKTVNYFGEPFDVYSEEEAIAEGYILDVAQNIISYNTLYNIGIKQAIPDKEFPAGVVSKALKNLAFNDDALIQYKSEVIVKLFLEKVEASILGKGKAMVVASSRPAGLKFFETIKTILEEKKLPYKPLFAFSDYTDPITHNLVEEVKINELDTLHNGELIEDVFELDEYRILVVANKFQTGFDQPLLSAMFLDKAVNGVNAIQTVSRLNRKHIDKEQDDILVVDFTNNSENIFKAFNQHRKGSPYTEREPDKKQLNETYQAVLDFEIFSTGEIQNYITAFIQAEKDAIKRISDGDTELSKLNVAYRKKFQVDCTDAEQRKEFIYLLNRYKKLYYFLAQFFELEQELHDFVIFAESMSERLINKGKKSELISLMKYLDVSKAGVTFNGEKKNTNAKPKTTTGGSGNGNSSPPRTTIEQALKDLEDKYSISEKDAIVIREVCEEVSEKPDIRLHIVNNKNDDLFLKNFEPNIQKEVKDRYISRNLWEKLEDPIYNDAGGIFSIMGKTVIQNIVSSAA